MAIPTTDTSALQRNREEFERAVAQVTAEIDRVINNEPNAPDSRSPLWHDELFRVAILRKLRGMRHLQEQAEHLRIIKSVFSGRA